MKLSYIIFILLFMFYNCATFEDRANIFQNYSTKQSCGDVAGVKVDSYLIHKNSEKNKIQLFDENCKLKYVLNDDSRRILAESFSSDKTAFILFFEEGIQRISIWKLDPAGPKLQSETIYDSGIGEVIKTIYLDHENNIVTGLSETGTIYFWNGYNGKLSAKNIKIHPDNLTGKAFIKTVKENGNNFVVIKSDAGIYYHKVSFEQVKENCNFIIPIHWTIIFNVWKQKE